MTEALAVDQDAERAVLGSLVLLTDPRRVTGLMARGLRPEHFYWAPHAAVYTAAISLADQHSAVDSITISGALDRLGLRGKVDRSFVDGLTSYVPAAGNVSDYADRVIELARWRNRLRTVAEMQEAGFTRDAKAWAKAAAALDSVTAGTRTESYSPEQWASLMFDYFAQTKEQVVQNAIPMPFGRLTEALGGGLMPGEVLVISGPTGHGKSTIGDQILDLAVNRGKTPHLYMTEMTAIARGQRYLARQTGVPFMRQRNMDLSERQRQAILGELPKWGFGCSIVADWAMEDITRDALRARYPLVMIDLVHGFHYEDERGLDRLSKELQKLARISTTLDGHPGTAVIGITHLKEEGLKNGRIPRPGLSSIKGGSSIKQDADFVMFVWQEQDANGDPQGDGEVWIAKGRSGEHARVEVRLNPTRFRFEAKTQEELASDAARPGGQKEDF